MNGWRYCILIFLGAAMLLGGSAPALTEEATDQAPLLYVKKFVIPSYPPLALQARVQGDVTADIKLDEEGKTSIVESLQGPPLLAGHVEEALKGWAFGILGHNPEKITVTFRFLLVEATEGRFSIRRGVGGELPTLVEVFAPAPKRQAPDQEIMKE